MRPSGRVTSARIALAAPASKVRVPAIPKLWSEAPFAVKRTIAPVDGLPAVPPTRMVPPGPVVTDRPTSPPAVRSTPAVPPAPNVASGVPSVRNLVTSSAPPGPPPPATSMRPSGARAIACAESSPP